MHLKYVIEFAEFLKGNLGVLRKQFLSTCLSIYMPVSTMKAVTTGQGKITQNR